MTRPLVSVLVPVRNGAATLARALDTIRRQTYRELDIVLSDNASSDETPRIMRSFVAEDPRAKYLRQDTALPVLEHFSSLIRGARGKYIVICAADDERNDCYVEALVDALERAPTAVLAFGDLTVVDEAGGEKLTPFSFENASLPKWRRLSRSAWLRCFHFYGLWRASVLKGITIRECTYWPDMQVMLSANCAGTFVRGAQARFIYHEKLKSNAERAVYQSYRPPRRFFRMAMFTTSIAGIIEAGGGAPLALWATCHLAAREGYSAGLVLRRRMNALRRQR